MCLKVYPARAYSVIWLGFLGAGFVTRDSHTLGTRDTAEEQVSHLSLLVSSEQRRNVFKRDQNVVASSCRSHCPFAVWYGLPKVSRGNCTHNGRKWIFWLPVSSPTKYHRGTI